MLLQKHEWVHKRLVEARKKQKESIDIKILRSQKL